MKCRPRVALITLPWNINHTARTERRCKWRSPAAPSWQQTLSPRAQLKSQPVSLPKTFQRSTSWTHEVNFHLFCGFGSWTWVKSGNAPVTHTHLHTQAARKGQKVISSLKDGFDFRAGRTGVFFFLQETSPFQLFLATVLVFFSSPDNWRECAIEPGQQTRHLEAARQPVKRWMPKTLDCFRRITCCSLSCPQTFT